MPYVDLYCERVGPGLWDEPINVLTNLAYVGAAWLIWRTEGPSSPGLRRLLSGLLAGIAVGSALFHMLATPWARLLDEAPILLFQLTFLWTYGTGVVGLSRSTTAGLIGGFVIATVGARQVPRVLNGSLAYGPALLLALGLAVFHYRTRTHERSALVLAVGLFALAIVFRSVDNAVCQSLPIGTHGLWHVLTAAALYLFSRGLVAHHVS